MKLLTDTNRWLFIVLASVLALGCDLGGDGDDGDSGGGGGGGDVVVLSTYAFELTSVGTDPLQVKPPDLPELQALRLTHVGEGPGITGTYNVDDETFTIDEGSTLRVEELAQSQQLFGDFTLEATGNWIIPVDGPPEQGSLLVTRGAELIYVDVAEAFGIPGVNIAWDESGDGTIDDEVMYGFEQLDEIMDSDAPEWQRLGIFAVQIGGDVILELASYGIGGLELVVDELADASPVMVDCDAFSSIGLAVPPPPPAIPDAGMLTFTWVDDALDGVVGPGDSFDLETMYCLAVVEPLEDEQVMLNGLVSLNSYTEVIENNTLVRIGFEGTSPGGRDGGVHFSDLERYEVYDSDGAGGSNVATVHLGATINGRMTLVFTEPAN
jgi:hypothetical protein